MERVFIKDVGKIKKGDVRDWPITTWNTFYKNWRRITKPVAKVAVDGRRKAA